MKRALLDNNIFNALLEEKNRDDLRCLLREVGEGRVQVVITAALLEEVAGAYNSKPQKALDLAALFFTLGKGLLLRDSERFAAELRAGRKLTFDEAYARLSVDVLSNQRVLEELLRTEGEKGYQRKLTSVANHEALEADLQPVREAQDPSEKRLTYEEALRSWQARASDFATGHMKIVGNGIGLPAEQVERLDPAQLPTFYRLALYSLTARCRYDYGKMGFLRSDLHDQVHFADAAYADVLVTSDGNFRDTVKDTGLKTVIFSPGDPEWDELLGRQRLPPVEPEREAAV